MLVAVIQRDPVMSLPVRFDRCVSSELSAGLPVPAWPAVAVLIRSLSTKFGVTHHSPVVAVLSQAARSRFHTVGPGAGMFVLPRARGAVVAVVGGRGAPQD